ncbi:MAG: ATP-binding cassette domain-containing protein, partial [Planctomycetota bacterium]
MLSVQSVYKSFGSFAAVRGISFDLPKARVVGLLGPNGAGKTTTIRMITGFFPPDRGRVVVDGHDSVDDSIAARAAIGYLPESAPLYSEMSVRSFLDFRARLYSLRRPARVAAVARSIDRCWLASVQDKRIGHLSKGFRQRVGLAAALLHDPKVLVLDEPTNGLDPTQINETRRLIAELGQDRTLLISSHILPEVERVCDRVIIVIRGRVRADGTPAELTASTGQSRTYRIEVIAGDEASIERTSTALRAVRFVATVTRRFEQTTIGRV